MYTNIEVELNVKDKNGTYIEVEEIDSEYSSITASLDYEIPSCTELAMLRFLKESGITFVDQIKELIEESTLTKVDVVEFIKKQPIDFQFNVVKELLKDANEKPL